MSKMSWTLAVLGLSSAAVWGWWWVSGPLPPLENIPHFEVEERFVDEGQRTLPLVISSDVRLVDISRDLSLGGFRFVFHVPQERLEPERLVIFRAAFQQEGGPVPVPGQTFHCPMSEDAFEAPFAMVLDFVDPEVSSEPHTRWSLYELMCPEEVRGLGPEGVSPFVRRNAILPEP